MAMWVTLRLSQCYRVPANVAVMLAETVKDQSKLSLAHDGKEINVKAAVMFPNSVHASVEQFILSMVENEW